MISVNSWFLVICR